MTAGPGRWRKKPVVIEAMQLVPGTDNYKDVCDWMLSVDAAEGYSHSGDGSMLIRTLEGTMQADPGDWIIRGVQGEFYPCKSDIFEATYERVADDERTNPVSEVRGGEAP